MTTEKAKRYDFKNTNWNFFKTKLADMVGEPFRDEMDLQSKAAKL